MNFFNPEDDSLIIQARLERPQMQFLDKLVEGFGHLGIVTTTNGQLGEIEIVTTRHCWPELKKAIKKMPLTLEFL